MHKIQYMSEKGVVHLDIKPENIVWGMMNNSKIKNKNEMYFIDYGFVISLQEIEQKVKKGLITGDTVLQDICLLIIIKI